MPILEVRGLVKYYGRRKVVDGVNFEVDAGIELAVDDLLAGRVVLVPPRAALKPSAQALNERYASINGALGVFRAVAHGDLAPVGGSATGLAQ